MADDLTNEDEVGECFTVCQNNETTVFPEGTQDDITYIKLLAGPHGKLYMVIESERLGEQCVFVSLCGVRIGLGSSECLYSDGCVGGREDGH